MNGQDKDFVYSDSVKAGKRIYYFDVKQSRNGENFVSITESKKVMDENSENSEFPHFTFEKHKIFLYKEDYEKFLRTLAKVVGVASGIIDADEARAEQNDRRQAEADEKAKELSEFDTF